MVNQRLVFFALRIPEKSRFHAVGQDDPQNRNVSQHLGNDVIFGGDKHPCVKRNQKVVE